MRPVQGFVGRSAERGRRTLLIVTGKGRRDGAGVLKSALPRWLNEAPLRDGHPGAGGGTARAWRLRCVLCLLRRRNRPS
jgi:DNA-nicking Smr family endonuclease